MSCPRSTASMESAAICLRALGWPWVAACQAREDAAEALRSRFQPITCLWQFEGLSVKHGPSDRFAPKAATWLNVSFGRSPVELPHTRCKYHVHPYGVIARDQGKPPAARRCSNALMCV